MIKQTVHEISIVQLLHDIIELTPYYKTKQLKYFLFCIIYQKDPEALPPLIF